MKYRATALVPGQTAPRQTFSAHLANVRDWARIVSKKEKCKVEIYVYEERLLETVDPPVPEPIKCSYNHETLKATSILAQCPDCGYPLKEVKSGA